MTHPRIIPCLLMAEGRLVKTIGFKNPNYVGDPLNVIRIFNDKFVDELVVLDINVTKNKSEPNYTLLEKMAKEAFMPMAYGGGIRSMENIANIFKIGYEKVIINQHAFLNTEFIFEASKKFGSQSILVAIDVIKVTSGEYYVFNHVKGKATKIFPIEYARKLEQLGVGEIIVYSVNQDGLMNGYDYELNRLVANTVSVPVVALGGAGKVEDLLKVIKNGVSAAGAGSMFIYRMPHKAVLISYPTKEDINRIIKTID